jgi:2-oxo-4-hydroxy-4-carboxy-5-ureidoimidazoline decarboxylase
MHLDTYATLDADGRRDVLMSLCGAPRWVERMLSGPPPANIPAFHAAAEAAFDNLETDDWLAAFAHHPRIGDRAALEKRFGGSGAHSAVEQSGVDGATGDVLGELFALNETYFDRHRHIFIVCATGKTAAEMLEVLKARVHRDAAEEIATCAAEQRKITALRIDKLFGAG